MNNRETNNQRHSPYCSCVECTNKRLKRFGIKPTKVTSHDDRGIKESPKHNSPSTSQPDLQSNKEPVKSPEQENAKPINQSPNSPSTPTNSPAKSGTGCGVWVWIVLVAIAVFFTILHSATNHSILNSKGNIVNPPTSVINNIPSSTSPTTLAANKNSATITTSTSTIKIATPTSTPITPIVPTVPVIATIVNSINSDTGTYKNFYLGLAKTPQGDLSGNGCYDDTGNFIILINNKNATNPTYSQLISFLQQDKTDEFPYIYKVSSAGFYYGTAESHVDLTRIQNILDGKTQPGNPDVCADFAERLHNDAELAGIKCAFVNVDLSGYSDTQNYGIPSNTSHACDAFQTTDRGLIYVDATGMSANIAHPTRTVATVNIAIGQQYIPVNIFPQSGWSATDQSMGKITDFQVIWDGNWNK